MKVVAVSMPSLGARAPSCSCSCSWDTQQRLPYNRNAPRNPNSGKLKTPAQSSTVPTPRTAVAAPTHRTDPRVADLLKRSNARPPRAQDESYLGYEQWLPSPPKVEKPRSVYNAALLAYIGDSIYELYARRHFLFPPLSIEEFNDRVTSVVRCEAQDELLQKLLADNYLSEEERGVLRWGKNVVTAKTRSRKRAGSAVYNRASSLETLIGYLYLTNVQRLEDVMLKLGFSTGASSEWVLNQELLVS
ncbi:mini-ribonuclease 3 [Rhodamnia argentea]|uniref:Mini-ribonuclease 3 n=1 Tax=Rhodamnia argentea TaxID=178133 RepID=A0A8B8NTW2_9MYRT|nr:mini-ribonuclease 3 [Rhodamnia argentea]